jgi:hypothetical protein
MGSLFSETPNKHVQPLHDCAGQSVRKNRGKDRNILGGDHVPSQNQQPLRLPQVENQGPLLVDFFPVDGKDLMSWHPNRTHLALSQLIASRMAPTHSVRMRKVRKCFDPWDTVQYGLRQTVQDPNEKPGKWDTRVSGRDLYRRLLSSLSGLGRKEVARVTGLAWKDLLVADRNKWALMCRVVAHRQVEPLVSDIFSNKNGSAICGDVHSQSRNS